jgi:hypothetical protein
MSRRVLLPKSTIERLAACEAVGLSYWADHPTRNCLWAIDNDRRAHVARMAAGAAQHVCGNATPVAVEQCAGDDEALPYTISGKQERPLSDESGRPIQTNQKG